MKSKIHFDSELRLGVVLLAVSLVAASAVFVTTIQDLTFEGATRRG